MVFVKKKERTIKKGKKKKRARGGGGGGDTAERVFFFLSKSTTEKIQKKKGSLFLCLLTMVVIQKKELGQALCYGVGGLLVTTVYHLCMSVVSKRVPVRLRLVDTESVCDDHEFSVALQQVETQIGSQTEVRFVRMVDACDRLSYLQAAMAAETCPRDAASGEYAYLQKRAALRNLTAILRDIQASGSAEEVAKFLRQAEKIRSKLDTLFGSIVVMAGNVFNSTNPGKKKRPPADCVV